MTNKERGKYIERYVMQIKKVNHHWDYRKYYWAHKLGIMYVVFEKDFGEESFIYQEWFRMWNPIIWITIMLQLPFILIMNGFNVVNDVFEEIKGMFKVDRRETVSKDRFNNFMNEYYPNKIEEFYEYNLENPGK